MLEELDHARVRLAEALMQFSCQERGLKAAECRKGEIERECNRLQDEVRAISEMVEDKKECLRDKEMEIQDVTAESAKYKDELKEVENSLATIYRTYESDRFREEEMKRRLDLLGREELDLMVNQQRIKTVVDIMKSDISDFQREIKEMDLLLEDKRRSVEEMKVEERARVMSIEKEKRNLIFIRENAAEESFLLVELRDKVALTNTDLNSAETDLRDVTSELKIKLDEIEENQKKFDNNQIENRRKLEMVLLELERVEGSVVKEKNMLLSLSIEHDSRLKDVCDLKDIKLNFDHSAAQLTVTVSELRESVFAREAEKRSLEKEVCTLQMSRAVEEDKLHSLSALIDEKNSMLRVTESDTASAVKKLNRIKSLCVAEERIISHQRLHLKCCLDEMLVYETKLNEKAVTMGVESSLGDPHKGQGWG